MKKGDRKGFTLIELLVVIAILAVLATAVVLIVDPAEFIRRSRDSQRLTDLGAINTALALYLTEVASPDLDQSNTACQAATPTALCTAGTTAPDGASSCTTDTDTAVDGTGWVPVDLTSMGGAPLPSFPIDPTNNTTYYYAYGCNNTDLTYEMNANLESERFSNGGADDKEASDGGNNAQWYEVGNEPGLDIAQLGAEPL